MAINFSRHKNDQTTVGSTLLALKYDVEMQSEHTNTFLAENSRSITLEQFNVSFKEEWNILM